MYYPIVLSCLCIHTLHIYTHMHAHTHYNSQRWWSNLCEIPDVRLALSIEGSLCIHEGLQVSHVVHVCVYHLLLRLTHFPQLFIVRCLGITYCHFSLNTHTHTHTGHVIPLDKSHDLALTTAILSPCAFRLLALQASKSSLLPASIFLSFYKYTTGSKI